MTGSPRVPAGGYLNPTAEHVWVVLADRADPVTGIVDVLRGELAAEIGVSPGLVSQALGRLVWDGRVTLDARRGSHGNRYRVK